MVFHRIPGGGFVMGDSVRLAELPDPALPFAAWPHAVTLGSFYMQEREVTKAAYARFVAAVPEWAPANRAALAARGLVAEEWRRIEPAVTAGVPPVNPPPAALTPAQADALARITAKVFVLPIDEDMFFPPRDCEAEHKLIPNSEFRVLHSMYGHLGLFGLEPAYLQQIDQHLGELLALDV